MLVKLSDVDHPVERVTERESVEPCDAAFNLLVYKVDKFVGNAVRAVTVCPVLGAVIGVREVP
jgi:hypothetical protein